jgi:spore coat polysaccharide biosynthesis protein SpsF
MTERLGAVIQVRMSSKRLPGKTLRPVHGKPLLAYIIERVRHCRSLDTFVVATSTERSDDPIAAFCKERRLNCFRGSLDNVAGRFLAVLDHYKFDGFVRVNGDSPLIDHHLIDKGVRIFLHGGYDVVTNILKRSYPKGQSIEVLNSRAFRSAYGSMTEDEEFEHVTKYFYTHRSDFNIYDFHSDIDYHDMQLSVDTEEDLVRFDRILSAMDRAHWEYGLKDIVAIYRTLGLE